MPTKNEKDRRKEILGSQREAKRRLIREGLPVSVPTLKDLFDYVDQHLESEECDNTLHYAVEFVRANKLPEEKVVAWLQGAGGYCDCEALSNAEELVEDAVPGYRELKP